MLTNNYTHEQDINNYKDWSSIHSFTSKMNVFDDYLETTDVCLCEYTTTDKWEKCLAKREELLANGTYDYIPIVNVQPRGAY